MIYIDGFVAAVPQENRQAYIDHTREALVLFKDQGQPPPRLRFAGTEMRFR